MPSLTVIYYTSNREYEQFEQAVRRALLTAIGDCPLISVSQQPIEFGHNICVGDIGASQENIVKQLRIGVEAATTDFVAPVESDMLYPADFFSTEGKQLDTFYYPEDGYIAWHGKGKFYRKRLRDLSCVVGRQHMLAFLKHLEATKPPFIAKEVRHTQKWETVKLSAPVLTIKTSRQLHSRSPYSKHDSTRSLPHWGAAEQLWEAFPCEARS